MFVPSAIFAKSTPLLKPENRDTTTQKLFEGNMEFVTNNGLSTEDNENIPVILALPATNAPPGGHRARLPFCQNNSELPDQGEEQLWDEDLLLPLTNIIYTMRTVLPADAGVPSDVAAIIQRATSDFILLVTNQTRERYNRERNKKVKGDDIIWALNKLGFTDYVRPLELYLSRYREHLKGTTQSGPSQLQLEQLSEASTSHGS